MTEEALKAYVDDFARGHVTHFFMCPVGQRASYDSKVWEPIWAGMDEPGRKDSAQKSDGTHDICSGMKFEDFVRKNIFNPLVLTGPAAPNFCYNRLSHNTKEGIRP